MSFMTRRNVLTGGTFLATMAMAPKAGLSQGAHPARPVRFIVGFPAVGTGNACEASCLEDRGVLSPAHELSGSGSTRYVR